MSLKSRSSSWFHAGGGIRRNTIIMLKGFVAGASKAKRGGTITLLLLVLGILLLNVALYYREAQRHNQQQHDRRREGLRQAADSLGFGYQAGPIYDLTGAVGALTFLTYLEDYGAHNVLTGTHRNSGVLVFDYRDQTVAVFPEGAQLPDLTLAPNAPGWFKRLVVTDFDFAGNEEFSAKYMVDGADEAAVRRAVDQPCQAFFAAHPGWFVQIQDGTAVILPPYRLVAPSSLPAFLDEAHKVLNAFARR